MPRVSPRPQLPGTKAPACGDFKASPSQPACRAAYAGDIRGLFAVLSEDPSQLNSQDGDSGDTPLIAACRRGNPRVVQYLLDNGADVHMSNKVSWCDRRGRRRSSCSDSDSWLQKQRTALHYVSRRTFSLLDYLMMVILMPILLIGYVIMVR